MHSQRRKIVPLRATLKWLVVLLPAWSQAALAVHQFEHGIEDTDAACSVCVQVERYGDAAVTGDAATALPVPAPFLVSPNSVPVSLTARFPHYQSRASP